MQFNFKLNFFLLYLLISGAVSGLFVIVILLIGVRFWYQKKQARRRPPHSRSRLADNVILNSAHDELKQHKLSNTDLNLPQRCPSPQPPPVPNRPASYTPSNHDSLNTLNNFDAVRNYGSAADQLENPHNIPVYTFDHLQTFSPYPRNCASIAPSLPPPPPSNSASDTDSIQKPNWDLDYPNILENYPECKFFIVFFYCFILIYFFLFYYFFFLFLFLNFFWVIGLDFFYFLQFLPSVMFCVWFIYLPKFSIPTECSGYDSKLHLMVKLQF